MLRAVIAVLLAAGTLLSASQLVGFVTWRDGAPRLARAAGAWDGRALAPLARRLREAPDGRRWVLVATSRGPYVWLRYLAYPEVGDYVRLGAGRRRLGRWLPRVLVLVAGAGDADAAERAGRRLLAPAGARLERRDPAGVAIFRVDP